MDVPDVQLAPNVGAVLNMMLAENTNSRDFLITGDANIDPR
jgi:hypothetical protein